MEFIQSMCPLNTGVPLMSSSQCTYSHSCCRSGVTGSSDRARQRAPLLHNLPCKGSVRWAESLSLGLPPRVLGPLQGTFRVSGLTSSTPWSLLETQPSQVKGPPATALAHKGVGETLGLKDEFVRGRSQSQPGRETLCLIAKLSFILSA